jgi:lysophospholipase L1-like esterase
MKNTFAPALLAFALVAAPLAAQEQKATPPAQPAPPKPAVVPPKQKADVAAIKYDRDGKISPRFLQLHSNFLARAQQGDVGVVFLGDSITQGWGGKDARPVWDAAFGQYKPANFGIGGDRTQHVLWRISHGELDGIKPKALVLMIGTNNSGSDPAEDIASGVTTIVKAIRAKLPETKILLLAVFPRGEKTAPNPGREKLAKVNALIAKLDDGKHVHYLDIGAKFLQPDGTLTKEIMPDFLHLSGKGYQIWADAISPTLAQWMK